MSSSVSRDGLGKIDCTVCGKLREIPPAHPGYDVTHAKLKDAAARGCQLCDLLRQVSEVAHGVHSVNNEASVSVYPHNNHDSGEPAVLSIRWDYRASTGEGQYIHNVLLHVMSGESH
jgi:hypothetical protein